MHHRFNNKIYIFIVLLLAGYYYYYQVRLSTPQESKSLSSYSQGPLATFLASQYLKQSHDGFSIRKSPLNLLEYNGKKEIILIMSPTRPLSALESSKLEAYVKAGGWVYASFHNRLIYQNLSSLIDKIGDFKGIRDWVYYKEGIARSLKINQETLLLKAGERINFYSPIHIDNGGNNAESLYQEYSMGEGGIIFQSGIPIFSNALLPLDDNRLFLERLKERFESIIVDEYHHYYQKTVGDLLLTPSFIFPIAFLLIVLVISLANVNLEQYLPQVENPVIAKQWPDYIKQMIAAQMKSKLSQAESNKLQSQVISRLFPETKERIERLKENSEFELFKSLNNIHQEAFNKRKG